MSLSTNIFLVERREFIGILQKQFVVLTWKFITSPKFKNTRIVVWPTISLIEENIIFI